MSSSNNRFGRRTGGQKDDLRAEPVLSFNPKRPATRKAQNEAGPSVGDGPSVDRTPSGAPRVDRADAEEFGAHFGHDAKRDPIPSFMRGSEAGPRIDREDAEEFGIERHDEDFDPRHTPREKAMEPRVPASERPLYHPLFDEKEQRGRGFGWIAALGSIAVVAIGAAYVWHNFMARPAPGNLLDPPGFASRGGNTGYTTPAQPTTNTDNAQDNAQDSGSAPSPLASTPPAATDPQPTRDVATAPQPKDVPYEPPPPPKKTISEAAASPGNLGAPVTPPPAATQPAVAPAPALTPPPKRDAAKADTPKRDVPRKEAAITPPKPAPAPAPQDTAPQDTPPAVTQPAAAPAVSAPPRVRQPQATGQPQQLNRNAPAAYPPPQQPSTEQQPQPNFATRSPPPVNAAPNNAGQNNLGQNNAGPQPGAPDTVTVDGVTYVNGQEPRSLGTLGAQPQAASNDGTMPPGIPAPPVQSAPPGYSTRYYAPADRDGGAPLPNDVIILPNGQMAVPNR